MEPEISMSPENARAVIPELQQYRLCSRCILRVVGVKNQWAYREPDKALTVILSTLNEEGHAGNPKTDESDGNGVDSNSKEGDNPKKPNENQSTSKDEASDTKDELGVTSDHKEDTKDITMEEGQQRMPVEKEEKPQTGGGDCEMTETDEKMEQKDQVPSDLQEKSVCGLCLGILQDSCQDVKQIGDYITDKGFQFKTFMMAVTLPLQLHIREHCLLTHMPGKLKPFNEIPSIKEVYKWMAGPVLGDFLGVQFHPQSPFEVMVTLKHDESEREVELLLEKYGLITTSTVPAKKQRGQPWRKKLKVYHAANIAPTRQQVMKAMMEMSNKLFKELFGCPPKCPSLPCRIEVMCCHAPLYIAGRYMKYSRNLSQSPWVIDGVRKTESSVEEHICEHTKKTLRAEDYKFSSSGREDVDVRTLGRGRPFVVEFVNPRMERLSVAELKNITQVVNSSTDKVKIRDLQMIVKEDTCMLKQGEEEKTKSYSALVWVEKEIKEDDIKFLADIKDLTLHQKTPVRVLHRRPLATRPRVVHNMTYDLIDSHHFRLDMNTQAGTYIKEFVHGDFGRTQPNLGTLLKTDADILELDVMAVNVDWPPTIEDSDYLCDSDPSCKDGDSQ